MAVKVSNLSIKPQSGNQGTFYASWSFNENTTVTSTSTTTSANGVRVGSLVSIVSGARYYNGVSIPSWVMDQKWYVRWLSGNRAVIDENERHTNHICSAINVMYLDAGTSTSTTTKTTTVKALDHYEVTWYYNNGDGWFTDGGSTNTTEKKVTYSPPAHADRIRVVVKPVSKTKEENGKETTYWTGTSVSVEYNLDAAPPEKPPTPSVDVKNLTLTAKIENISDPRTDQIQFQVLNGSTVIKSSVSTVSTCRATMTCSAVAGGEYRVRCRAINIYGSSKLYSAWTEYTNPVTTIPATPSGITSIRATSETSIYLAWKAAKTATTYDIEYTTKQSYFNGSDQTTTVSGIEFTHYEKTGLETGQQYFFRVRAVNDAGHSSWSGIKSVIIGDEPGPPTTWSSTTTAVVGEALKLYWVHNSEDNSSETSAQIELYINGVKSVKTIVNTETDEDEKDNTKVYTIDTSTYTEGTQIQWRVRTAGITKVYGDWSIQRTIDVYAPPVLTLEVTNLEDSPFEVLTSFPFHISASAGPDTQSPVGYQVTITSNEIYETVDNTGNVKMVNAGAAVYSKYFDISESLSIEMTPAVINLDNGISYTITCVVSMNSGLTAEASTGFTVDWEDDIYYPNAEIAVDPDSLVAHIRPYCEESFITYYKVNKSGYRYIKTDEIIETIVDGTLVDGEITTTNEDVFFGTMKDGNTTYYCEIETRNLVEGITLSLYRREFDGTFVELATGLENTDYTFVTDPHPALDYARYRVVAVTNSTGAISFYDIPGYPTGISDIIIQWDEDWNDFSGSNADEMEQPPWSGSLLRLPYDIDVSETTKPDVALVNYAGRSNPVSYYGTQVGQTATWNTNVVYDDKDTIYALRRLQRWMGDVYVREPSGSGYWANITVQFSQKHCDVYVPVTLSITRVEGGI